MAKMVNFGLAYGMSDFGLASRANIPRKEAQEFINSYFAAYSGISYYMMAIKEQAKAQGWVETLLGRKRQIPELRASNPALRGAGERMAINMPIQGTAADIQKIAMIRVAERLRGAGPARPAAAVGPRRAAVRGRRATRSSRWRRSSARRWRARCRCRCRSIVDVKVGDDWESMTPLTRADAIAAEADELPLEAPVAPLAGVGSRRCPSFPRSRPSRATCARASSARRSSAPAARGRGRCARTRPRPSPRRSPAGAVEAVGRRAKQLVVELSGDAALTIHLKMTGQLFVVPGGRARGPVRPARPRAGRRPRAALPRHPQVRQDRAVRPRPGDRRARRPRSAARRCSRRSGRSRSTRVHAARLPAAAAPAEGPAQAAAARPVVPGRASATSTPTRRCGGAAPSAADGGDPAAARRAAPVRGDPTDPGRGGRAARLLDRRLHRARRRRLDAGAAGRLPADRRAVPALRPAGRADRRSAPGRRTSARGASACRRPTARAPRAILRTMTGGPRRRRPALDRAAGRGERSG